MKNGEKKINTFHNSLHSVNSQMRFKRYLQKGFPGRTAIHITHSG